MTGAEHYALAAQHAEVAAELYDDGETTRAEERIRLALVHVGLAQAAATALGAVLPLVGGDSTEVTAWARMIGVIEEPAKPDDVVEAVIYPAHWPPMVGDLWADPSGHRWFARRGDDGVLMVSCYQGDAWGGELPDFCSPDVLLKDRESLTLLNREEAPF